MKKFCVLILACVLLQPPVTSGQGLQILHDLIQQNFAGDPVIHKKVEWTFDPDISKKRRAMFYKLHGYRGDKLIERLGLGIDGNEDERLEQQRARDAGHLGGLNAFRD